MNLHQYLLAIAGNKAIKLKLFLPLLPAKYQHNWRSIFNIEEPTGKDNYILSVIDQQCFKTLLANTKPSQNRIEAATLGNSHQHNASMSFLLVYPGVLIKPVKSEAISCPKVVIIDGSILTQEFAPQKTLVIIENQENFFRYQAFLSQLTSMTVQVDIAFGQGNCITNSLNSLFFDQYQEIQCCFDYDLGGLTMFSSLIKLTKAKVKFILPPADSLTNEAFVNTHFKKTPEKANHWQKAISLAVKIGLDDLAHAFNISKKFMEQEVYLSNSASCVQEGKK